MEVLPVLAVLLRACIGLAWPPAAAYSDMHSSAAKRTIEEAHDAKHERSLWHVPEVGKNGLSTYSIIRT